MNPIPIFKDLLQSADLARFTLDWIVGTSAISFTGLLLLFFLKKATATIRQRISILSLSLLLSLAPLLLLFEHNYWIWISWGTSFGEWGMEPANNQHLYPWLVWTAILTIAGAIILTILFLARFLTSLRTEKKLSELTNQDQYEKLLSINPVLEIFSGVVTPSNRQSPFVIGLERPLLIIPQPFLNEATPHDLQLLIAHEASHVRQRDNLQILISHCAQFLLWWNPFVFLIRRELALAAEQAADEAATQFSSSRRHYVDWLLKKLSHQCPQPFSINTSYFSGMKPMLTQRALYLVQPIKSRTALAKFSLLVLPTITLLTLLIRSSQKPMELNLLLP